MAQTAVCQKCNQETLKEQIARFGACYACEEAWKDFSDAWTEAQFKEAQARRKKGRK